MLGHSLPEVDQEVLHLVEVCPYHAVQDALAVCPVHQEKCLSLLGREGRKEGREEGRKEGRKEEERGRERDLKGREGRKEGRKRNGEI